MKPSQRNEESQAVSLFPFLAVLLCTMGALLVLLVVMSHIARKNAIAEEQAKRAKTQIASAAPLLESFIIDETLHSRAEKAKALQAATEAFLKQSKRLQTVRQEGKQRFQNAQLRLGHSESEIRKLADRFSLLRQSIEELQNAEALEQVDHAQAKKELKRLEDLIAETKQSIEAAKKSSGEHKKSYAIIPYKGENGTNRRPIYIECREDSIVLQPEGIALSAKDFLGPMGPGNPLASALRAIREHYVETASISNVEMIKPYPLLLIRPKGISAYYRARDAIESWGPDFGYEMVDGDWDLNFPDADPLLATKIQQTILMARVRQRELAKAAPRKFGGQLEELENSYEGNSLSQGLGGNGEAGGGLGNGMTGNERYGNAEHAGGNSSSGNRGNSYVKSGQQGTGQAHYGQFSQANTNNNSSGGNGQSRYGQLANGAGNSIAGNENGTGTNSSAGTSGQGGGGRLGQRAKNSNSNPYRPGTSSNGQGEQNGLAKSGQNGNREGASSSVSGNRDGSARSGNSSSAGASQNGNQLAAGNPNATGGPGGSAASGSANGQAGSGSRGPSFASSFSEPQGGMSSGGMGSNSRSRGGGRWPEAAPRAGAIPIQRTLHVTVRNNQFSILPDTSGSGGKNIAIAHSVEASAEQLVTALRQNIKGWGIAGKGLYWKPKLILNVSPSGARNARYLATRLNGTGLEVQTKPETRRAGALR